MNFRGFGMLGISCWDLLPILKFKKLKFPLCESHLLVVLTCAFTETRIDVRGFPPSF